MKRGAALLHMALHTAWKDTFSSPIESAFCPDQRMLKLKVLAYPSGFDPAAAFPALDPQGRIWVAGMSTTARPMLFRYDAFKVAGQWTQTGSASSFLRLDAFNAPDLFTIDVTQNAVDVLNQVGSQQINIVARRFPGVTVSDLATDSAEKRVRC